MKKFQLIGASALTLLSAVAFAPVLSAAPLLPQKGDAEETEEEKDTYLALVGGDVHTGLGGVLREPRGVTTPGLLSTLELLHAVEAEYDCLLSFTEKVQADTRTPPQPLAA